MQIEGAQVAVTGATGFLGRYIVDALLRRGARVVGVVRNPGRVPELVERGVEMRRADLADRPALVRALEGTDALVSNAALFSLGNRDWDDHVQANVEGTRNVLDAAGLLRLRRVVHVSSVAVYQRHREPQVREEHPQFSALSRRRPWTIYPISKALSEQLAIERAQEHDLDLTSIRPCAIYGAHDPNITPLVRRLAERRVSPIPVGTRFPLVYAGDVADAVARALERDRSIRRSYNVTGTDATLWEVVRAWRQAGGRSPWLKIPIPFPYRRRFDNARAERELGWSNRPLVDGFRETLELERRALHGGSTRP